MSKKKIDWPNFALALACGAAIGASVPLLAAYFGMTNTWVTPIAGGLAGGAVPLIYGLRTRTRSKTETA